MFIDYAKIYVSAGRGGDGCVSFRREKYVPKGGPDGGDGGKGGDVVVVVNRNLRTLIDFRYKRHYKARNGEPGKGQKKFGKDGQSVILEVPPGTVIKDAETGEMLFELIHEEDQKVLVKGGKGGRGNSNFATPTNQAPRHFEEGGPGEEKWVILELKLLAEVGLVGLPNAGKSTLLSRMTSAKPEIANYPFTTKIPNLGIVHLDAGMSYVMADIPGIIEGAHEGKGLGLQFLRHIERTKILLYLIDASEDRVTETYETLRDELARHNPNLVNRPSLLVLNKIDEWESRELLTCDWNKLPQDIMEISALTGKNIKELKFKIWDLLKKIES